MTRNLIVSAQAGLFLPSSGCFAESSDEHEPFGHTPTPFLLFPRPSG